MDNITYVSYSEWISLISDVTIKGLACEELSKLKVVYPHAVGESYDNIIYNQLAKLEQFMLKETIRIFQKQMSTCLSEIDLEMAENAFVKIKKHYKDCMFFLQIPDYSESVKRKMSDEIIRNMQAFSESYIKYIKKIEFEDNSTFIQDYVYVCKRNLKIIKNMY